MDKYRNKYRIQSARLHNWDYGSTGLYFITICTNQREHYFGEIKNSEMNLNPLGIITMDEWNKTPQMRPDMNLELGEFVAMPNHFHGIVAIGENKFNDDNRRDAMHRVSTTTTTATPPTEIIHQSQNKFGPQSKNLGSIIRGFKSSVTTFARKNNIAFKWQERFHDHVIRNHDEYIRISDYIKNNPANWREDKFYK